MINKNGVMVGSFEAQDVFVKMWKESYPYYGTGVKPPQAVVPAFVPNSKIFANASESSVQSGTIQTLQNSTAKKSPRLLQIAPKVIDQTLICARPSNPVSF
jgi:hypothetical protein